MKYLFYTILVVSLFTRTLEVISIGWWAEGHSELGPGEGSLEEVRIARDLAEGRGFRTPFGTRGHFGLSPSAHSPPGFPFLLAGLIRAARLTTSDTELPYRICRILSIVSGSVAAGLLALAGSRAAGLSAGWTVGLLAAFLPTLVTQSAILWDTPYALLAVAVGATFAAPAPKPRSTLWYAAVGLFDGLATLFNPIVAPFLAAATAARLSAEGRRLRLSLVVAVTWSLCLAPWFVRNAIVFHRLIPIRHNLGLELWLGNLPGADGRSAIRRHPMDSVPEQRLIDQIGESSYMQMRTKDAITLIRSSPVRFLKLIAWRACLYWFGDVSRPTRLFGKFVPMFFGFNLLKAAANSLLLAVALTGLWRWPSRPGRLALGLGILTLPMPYYVTHVSPNYRAIVDPLVCLLAGTFLATIVNSFLQRRRGVHDGVHGLGGAFQ